MLSSNYAKEEAECKVAVGGSAECFGGDIGGPLAEAGSSWNHHNRARSVGWTKADLLAHSERNRSCPGPHGNGPVGSRARRYRQPSACPANTKGQRKISGCSAATLGGKNNPFNG